MMVPPAVVTTVAFIVALGILVFVHELGHFAAAKRLGVKVLRFSIGFGPVIWKRSADETEYAISALPLGGYVKMLGEEDGDEALAEPERAFSQQTRARRASIVAAGPVMNFVFAFLAYACLFVFVGVESISSQPVIGGVQGGSPADRAGLQVGDRVLSVDGAAIPTWESLSNAVVASNGKTLTFGVRRDDKEFTVQLTPELKESRSIFGEPEKVYRMGVEATREWKTDVSAPQAILMAGKQTWTASVVVATGLFKMLQGRVPLKELGGPIAIARAAGQQARQGLRNFFSMLAFLSINLGVLNLLPIPALDGGHLALLGVEGALRRPIRARHREIAQQVGFFLLLTLMVFVFYNDIHRLVQG